MAGEVLFGRGPDGTNTRVNAQGVGVPFGTPSKASLYNPGTLAQRLAIRMMQERARQRVAGGGQAQSDTYAQNMAEWQAAQAAANVQLQQARNRFATTDRAKSNSLVSDEFSLDNFLPDYLRADRGRGRIAEEQRNLMWSPRDPQAVLDANPAVDPYKWEIKGPDPLGRDALKPSPLTDIQWTPGSEAPAGSVVPPERTDLILGSDAPGSPAGDPTLDKYKKLRAAWIDAASKGLNAAPDTGADGDFGTSTNANSNSTTMGISEATAFQYLLVGTGSDKTVEKGVELYAKLVGEAMADPQRAGELMASMVAIGAYGGGSEKYVQDRLYPVIGKDGQPTLKGRFTVDDLAALKATMAIIANDQANKADAVIAGGGSISEIPGFEELLAQRGLERQGMAATLQPAGNSSGGGGGGGRRRGGGGGGGGGGARFTDPEQLKSLIDGIARQRLGRILTTEEAQAFANYYHSQEAATGGINYLSGGGRVLDPESQAIAWIESRYRDEGAKQQQGTYFGALLKMLQGSAFTSGGVA